MRLPGLQNGLVSEYLASTTANFSHERLNNKKMHAVTETTKDEKRDAEEIGRFYYVKVWQLTVVTEQFSWLAQEL